MIKNFYKNWLIFLLFIFSVLIGLPSYAQARQSSSIIPKLWSSCSIGANPAIAGSGQSVLLTWTASGYKTISFSGFTPSGGNSFTVNPITTTTYGITAVGFTNTSSCSVTVTVKSQPIITLTAPVTVDYNTSASINYTIDTRGDALNKIRCTRLSTNSDSNWNKLVEYQPAISGSITTIPLLKKETYTMTCRNIDFVGVPAASKSITIALNGGNCILGGNNQIQAQTFCESTFAMKSNSEFIGSFVANKFINPVNLFNINFKYDPGFDDNQPPGFRDLNISVPGEVGNR